jgi:hypothetical protein
MTYTSNFIGDNTYEIESEFNDEPVKFRVVVASDESEVEGLVDFYLDSLANPKQIVQQENSPTNLESLVQEQQALITTLTDRITALEAK